MITIRGHVQKEQASARRRSLGTRTARRVGALHIGRAAVHVVDGDALVGVRLVVHRVYRGQWRGAAALLGPCLADRLGRAKGHCAVAVLVPGRGEARRSSAVEAGSAAQLAQPWEAMETVREGSSSLGDAWLHIPANLVQSSAIKCNQMQSSSSLGDAWLLVHILWPWLHIPEARREDRDGSAVESCGRQAGGSGRPGMSDWLRLWLWQAAVGEARTGRTSVSACPSRCNRRPAWAAPSKYRPAVTSSRTCPTCHSSRRRESNCHPKIRIQIAQKEWLMIRDANKRRGAYASILRTSRRKSRLVPR